MNKYAVALLSFYDNENKLFLVRATNEVEAMKQALIDTCETDEGRASQAEWSKDWITIEEVKKHCFNGELAISTPLLID